MHKVVCGPTAFFDCDDTLLMWSIPDGFDENDLVQVRCRGLVDELAPNKYNIDLLKKMATRGHAIVVWSGGGSDWADAVVKALGLTKYVSVVTSKPTYYIDDVADPKLWVGKHGYFDINGNRYGHQNAFTFEKDKE